MLTVMLLVLASMAYLAVMVYVTRWRTVRIMHGKSWSIGNLLNEDTPKSREVAAEVAPLVGLLWPFLLVWETLLAIIVVILLIISGINGVVRWVARV